MNQNNLTDEQLMKQFQNGDRQSYNQLVFKYRDRLLNYINTFIHDLTSAEDLVQDTFIKVYLKKDSYREIAKFSTWLYTIAGNLAKTELRKLKRRKTSTFTALTRPDGRPFEPPEKPTEPGEDNVVTGEEELLNRGLFELEEDFRNILILRENQELSYEVISKILKLPLGTVKSRINRGKLKLREILINKGVKR